MSEGSPHDTIVHQTHLIYRHNLLLKKLECTDCILKVFCTPCTQWRLMLRVSLPRRITEGPFDTLEHAVYVVLDFADSLVRPKLACISIFLHLYRLHTLLIGSTPGHVNRMSLDQVLAETCQWRSWHSRPVSLNVDFFIGRDHQHGSPSSVGVACWSIVVSKLERQRSPHVVGERATSGLFRLTAV